MRKISFPSGLSLDNIWEQYVKRSKSASRLGDFLPLLELTVNDQYPFSYLSNKACQFLLQKGSFSYIMLVTNTETSINDLASTCSEKKTKSILKADSLRKLIGKSREIKKDIKFEDEYLTIYYIPLGILKGVNIGLLAIGKDLLSFDISLTKITADLLRNRIKTENALEKAFEANNRLSTIAYHLTNGMIMLDDNNRVTVWNRPMQRMTGFSPQEALGNYFQKVLVRPDKPNWLEEFRERFPQIASFSDEFTLANGKTISITGAFLGELQKRITTTIMIIRDVSDQKMLEEKKNEFIFIATHELRTPVTVIKGYLDLLVKSGQELSEKHKTFLERIGQANHRLTRLAEDLLRVVRIEQDQTTVNIKPLDLYNIVKNISNNFIIRCQQKEIYFSIENPEFETRVFADQEKTEVVISNLIDNAIKYTRPGGHVTVQFKESHNRHSHEKQINLQVIDTGIGIEPKKMEQLFTKFYRAHAPEEVNEPGTGLGLFITKSFVEKQGGTIAVTSVPEKGTMFEVTFPRADSALKSYNKKENINAKAKKDRS